MAQETIRGPGAKVDLRDEIGPHEANLAGFLGTEPADEGTRGRTHRFEALIKRPRHGGAESRADAPDVMQAVAPVDAENQRTDGVARGGRWDETRHHELLAGGAFRLDPAFSAAPSIGRIAQLRHHAFEAEAAGVLEHELAALVEMPAEPDRSRSLADDPLKRRLAGDERSIDEIVAIEIEKVEGVIEEPVRPPLAEVRLKSGEIRGAGRTLDDHLAVDQRFADGQRL